MASGIEIASTLRTGPPALLVIDLNALCVDPASPLVQHMARRWGDLTYFEDRVARIIPNVNRLAEAVRATGGGVLWVRPEMRTHDAEDWPAGYRAALRAVGMSEPSHQGLANFELHTQLTVAEGDHDVPKFCTSAYWGGRALQLLRDLEPSAVLLAGCFTDGGVVVNAVDTTSTGFNAVIVDDACAALTEERHAKALWLQRRLFQVSSTDQIVDALTERQGA